MALKLITLLLGALFVLPLQAVEKVKLTPQEVAERIIKDSKEAKLVNLQTEQQQFPVKQARAVHEWHLQAQTNYKSDQAEKLSGLGNERDQTLDTSLGVTRRFGLGTELTFAAGRISQKSDLSTFSKSISQMPNQVQDTITLQLAQPLLRNWGGKADRLQIQEQEEVYSSKLLDRLENLEDLLMSAMQLYWETYVNQENLKESTQSREAYEKLVQTVKHKTSLGYGNPGELTQVQAELEARNQQVKIRSSNYVGALDALLTRLEMPPGSEIEFTVPEQLPVVPELPKIEIDKLRKVVSLKTQINAADLGLGSKESLAMPDLKLSAQAASTGIDEKPEYSLSELASGTHPTYFVGLMFEKTLGSNIKIEEITQQKLIKTSLEVNLKKAQDDLAIEEANQRRKVQALYASAKSALAQKELRAKAVQEIQRGYSQGRSQINDLITAMNAFFAAQTNATKTIGDYHIALNEWAALRDELIKTPSEGAGDKL